MQAVSNPPTPADVPYTALTYDAFATLTYRQQIEEFRKLGLEFTTEQEFCLLLIPADEQYPNTHIPLTLPTNPDGTALNPSNMTLLQTTRHISYLDTKLRKLQKLHRQLINETKRLVRRAREPPRPADIVRSYTESQLLHIRDYHLARLKHSTLRDNLFKHRNRLLCTHKKTLPPTFYVPFHDVNVAPPTPVPSIETTADEHASLLLADWTHPLPGKPRQRNKRRAQTTSTPTSALTSFTQRIHTAPQPNTALTSSLSAPPVPPVSNTPSAVPTPISPVSNPPSTAPAPISAYRTIPTTVPTPVPTVPASHQMNPDDVGGHKTGFDKSMGTLTTCTLNINGLTEPKLDLVLLHMQRHSIAVYILIDTHLTSKSAAYLSKRARQILGPGTRVHNAKVKDFTVNKKNTIHKIGGIMFIIAPTWGPSLLTCQDDYSESGALSSISLQTTTGRISIIGTYWPIHHTMDGTTLADQNLWARIASYLHSHKHRETPIEYLQRLILTWCNTAMAAGTQACIIAGDLNSTWTSDEPGGQRSIGKWATDNGMCNGPLLLAAHRHDSHITRPANKDSNRLSSWIDHMLHIGEVQHIDPISSYTSTGAEWIDVTDHRPLWVSYRTGHPTAPLPQASLRPPPCIELDLSDKRITADYTEAMRKYALHRPPDLSTSQSAAACLLDLQTISPIITDQLNNKYGKGKPGGTMKDGWSPSYMVLKLYLIMVIEIKRKITGAKQRRRWRSLDHAQTGIQWLILELQTHIDSLDLPKAVADKLLHDTGLDLHWWSSLAQMPTVADCDQLIDSLRKLMQGRLRTDFRVNMNYRVAQREHMREQGKMKTVIRSILGVHGGRKHVETLNLDVIKNSSGDIAVSPVAVHHMITDHFQQWYAAPTTGTSRLHTSSDWQGAVASLEAFQSTIEHTNTPKWASEIIYDAMTNNPQRESTANELQLLLANPPSNAEFLEAIKHLHTGSAPGMSGCSYNMIKMWPDSCKQIAYDCLARQWEDKYRCPSWKWRWLVPIPKKHNDITMLNDLRPLMLIEALRKIWTGLIITKMQSTWRSNHTLNDAQHGCQKHMGTATASLLHIDSIEAAHEAGIHLHRSSWDKSRAFDSVSKNLMRLAWHRHGVPDDIIEYLVELDIDGPTIARTPHAATAWKKRPYACTNSIHQPHPIDDPVTQLLSSFTADRGTGQGDVSSPACWNAIFDILLTALRRDELATNATRPIRTNNQAHYDSTETAYVDDLVSCCTTPEAIQRKADIVSAFCLITGISMSRDKLRRVVHTWAGNAPATPMPAMYIHEYGWIPHAITATTDGSTNYLGVAYDADNSGKTPLASILSTVKTACSITANVNASDTTKRETILCSTLAKGRYTGKLTNLTLSQYRTVDKVFNQFHRNTTKNLHGFPADLLYLSWKYGGLDLPRFSEAVQLDKYQMLLSALQATGSIHNAAQAHLHRAVRNVQGDLIQGQGVTIRHVPTKSQHRWIDSLTQYLQEAGIFLSRHGTKGTELNGDQPIYDFIPTGPQHRTICNHLRRYGLHVLDDIDATDATDWILPPKLHTIRHLLPDYQDKRRLLNPSLRIGQCWKSQLSTNINEVVSWNDHLITVYVWSKHTTRSNSTYARSDNAITLTYDDMFPTDCAHTRVSILADRGSTTGSSCVPRIHPAPHTDPIPPSSQPAWLQWVHDNMSCLQSYEPAFYTDGAYKDPNTLNSIFQPTTSIPKAAAAVVIKDNSASWRSKPIYVIRITDGEAIGASSAYSMEFLALAMAMNASANISNKSTMSDAESIIRMLPKRKEELRNTRKTHHIFLQSIDKLLASGVPYPEHIRSHPEIHKPDRATWTTDDWGNYIADRTAGNDILNLRKSGLDIRELVVSAPRAVKDLLEPGQWYLSDTDANPISVSGLRELMHRKNFEDYVRTRDGYRKKRGDPIKWAFNTIPYAALTLDLQHRTINQRAVDIRRLWDKGWHGGNRAKDERLKVGTPEHTNALACDLCSLPDSADHWMHQCQHGVAAAVRTKTLEDLDLIVQATKYTDVNKLATAFQTLLLTTDEPARIWTGNFNEVQRRTLEATMPGTLSDTRLTECKTLLISLLKSLHTGATLLWFNKLGAQTSPNINATKTKAPPSAEAVIAMLNPLTQLQQQLPPKKKRGRKRKPIPSAGPNRPTQPVPTPVPTTAPTLTIIGPTQPNRLLSLPRPDAADIANLTTAMRSNPADTILFNEDNLAVTCDSFYTVQPQTWLDDQVIHAYLALLRKRNPTTMYVNLVHTHNYFPPNQPIIDPTFIDRLCPNLPINTSDLIFIPININNSHWTLVAIDQRRKKIAYYDSLRGDGTLYVNNAIAYLTAQSAHTAHPFVRVEWEINLTAANAFPAQPNGYDCGIYVLMVADLLASDLPVSLLSIQAMSHARVHVAMALWLHRAPDLRPFAPYHFPSTPLPPNRITVQTSITLTTLPTSVPNVQPTPNTDLATPPDLPPTPIVPPSRRPPTETPTTTALQTTITSHFTPTGPPTTPLPTTRAYGPLRTTRHEGVDYPRSTEKKLTKKQLSFLPDIQQEDTSKYEDRSIVPKKANCKTCKLGIGDSQQYDGGKELFLAQSKCPNGKIITFYNGTTMTKDERNASTSRYIFEYAIGDPDVHGDRPHQPTAIIDAIDPKCGYGRYSDDDLYNDTANADWTVVGTGAHTRLALVARKDIAFGMPIRARYGWEYWYQPDTHDMLSMQRAYRGYLEVIANDPDHALAMQFATAIGYGDDLLARWGGIPRHLSQPTTTPTEPQLHPYTAPLQPPITPTETPLQPTTIPTESLLCRNATPTVLTLPFNTSSHKRTHSNANPTAANPKPRKKQAKAESKKRKAPSRPAGPAVHEPDHDSDSDDPNLPPQPTFPTRTIKQPYDLYRLSSKRSRTDAQQETAGTTQAATEEAALLQDTVAEEPAATVASTLTPAMTAISTPVQVTSKHPSKVRSKLLPVPCPAYPPVPQGSSPTATPDKDR